MYAPFLGRILQLCGMIILPIGLLYGLAKNVRWQPRLDGMLLAAEMTVTP